jgi:hypothetical protein
MYLKMPLGSSHAALGMLFWGFGATRDLSLHTAVPAGWSSPPGLLALTGRWTMPVNQQGLSNCKVLYFLFRTTTPSLVQFLSCLWEYGLFHHFWKTIWLTVKCLWNVHIF